MTEPAHVEEIDVPPVPEPETPQDGTVDPGDTYTEGGSDEA